MDAQLPRKGGKEIDAKGEPRFELYLSGLESVGDSTKGVGRGTNIGVLHVENAEGGEEFFNHAEFSAFWRFQAGSYVRTI